jgi:Lon-like ATP-dependent protease
LIPHAKETTGIPSDKVVFGEGSIDMLIRNYCRESGVRNLQKHIEKVYCLPLMLLL